MSEFRSNRQFCELVGLPTAKRQIAAMPDLVRKVLASAAGASAERMKVRAAALAPRRREPVGTYTGGALRAHVEAKVLPGTASALVGIRKGLQVVTRAGRQVVVTRARSFQRVSKKGRYRALLTRRERGRVAAAGGVAVQPTTYGHFSEFGSSRQPAQAWMRQAAALERAAFEQDMRQAAERVGPELATLGLRR